MVFCTSESQAPVMHHKRHVHQLILELHMECFKSVMDFLDGRHLSPCAISVRTFAVLSTNWVCGIAAVFCATCASNCLTRTSTSLTLRQDKDSDHLADDLQPLNLLSTVWTIGTCRCATTGHVNNLVHHTVDEPESKLSVWFCGYLVLLRNWDVPPLCR